MVLCAHSARYLRHENAGREHKFPLLLLLVKRHVRPGVFDLPYRERAPALPGRANNSSAGILKRRLHGAPLQATQSCMNAPQAQDDQVDELGDRRLANIVLAVAFVLLVGGGIWLANAMIEARKADQCMSSGRRNCNPVEVPSR
jgi:hypothetical protein